MFSAVSVFLSLFLLIVRLMYNFYQYFLVLVAIALKRKFFHSICVGVVNYEFRDDVSGSLAIIFRIQHHFQEQVCKTASLFPEY